LNDKLFLKGCKLPIKTDNILAPSPAKFLSQVDNNFVRGSQKNKLTPAQYEAAKTSFLNSPDMKMILYCLNLIKDNPSEEIILVTEETVDNNDSKLFQKIPAICQCLNINTLTLPKFLKKLKGIKLSFS